MQANAYSVGYGVEAAAVASPKGKQPSDRGLRQGFRTIVAILQRFTVVKFKLHAQARWFLFEYDF